jgi:hypothetical protein
MLAAWLPVEAKQALLASKNENIIPCAMKIKKLLVSW